MSSKPPIFSRRIKVFGNVAVLILCCIFFLVPFAFRGARIALRDMRNEVSDWLPEDFPETQELNWFRDNFMGSQFILLSWDGCNTDDERFKALLDKLKRDSLDAELSDEEIKAKELADKYGLHVTESLYEEFGSEGEKWLIGDRDEWYYITKDGGLYRWTGGQNVVGWLTRKVQRIGTGKNKVNGDLIWQFTPEFGNELYRFPRRLNSRLFSQVMTGPDVFNDLAGPNGSLIRGTYDPRDSVTLNAEIEAHQRLTGIFFGPTPQPGFAWTTEAFWEALPQKTRDELPSAWSEFFDEYVDGLVTKTYGGDRDALLAASEADQLAHWYTLFFQLQVEPPPRQTCIVASLSDVASRDLSRVVGRPDFFKPVGRVYQGAEQSGISVEELHLGGPPVDNVAIDEEGTITLFKLVSLSTLIGVTLAYISFRSFNVTLMIFFVGGVSAVMSLGFVWFGGSSLDAVLLSMPSLVYVLGLSGAVHIVNYYREACHEDGPTNACVTAIKHGWFPCTLAAFTTALGLISLYASNLIPIQKFGLFSAIGTMATVILLFTYLPSALTLWSPGYKKSVSELHNLTIIHRMWDAIGKWIVKHYAIVGIASLILMIVAALGLKKTQTSVQLLKLFDGKAKVISDYQWLESNIGRLVPMELVLAVDTRAMTEVSSKDSLDIAERQMDFLERMELSARVRRVVEEEFGERNRKFIGPGMSADVMVLPETLPEYDRGIDRTRSVANQTLLDNREALLSQLDFIRVDQEDGRELWRISLRLGAFNNVDYGRFVADLMQAVEPVLTSYRTRDRIIESMYLDLEGDPQDPKNAELLEQAKVLIVGWQPRLDEASSEPATNGEDSVPETEIDQAGIFCANLQELLENRGFSFSGRGRGRKAYALDLDNEQHLDLLTSESGMRTQLDRFACVVVVTPPDEATLAMLEASGTPVIMADDFYFEVDPESKERISETANDMRLAGTDTDHNFVTAVYTGIVPIVYKAQRTLLASLIDSIGLAFAMIAVVMMILLRDWRRKFSPLNSLNVAGGLVSMIPNVFPVVLIFGFMGHLGIEIDIGSMMTASVALGVAVDDTIHFLSWFRLGMREGLSRKESIRSAYAKVATAMTQTTLIAGLGLSAFAFSTFTPTQRFGVLMLTLLFAALLGDLIFLPALLASPFGRLLGVKPAPKRDRGEASLEPVEGRVDGESTSSLATASNTEPTKGFGPHRDSDASLQLRQDRPHGHDGARTENPSQRES